MDEEKKVASIKFTYDDSEVYEYLDKVNRIMEDMKKEINELEMPNINIKAISGR